MKILLPILLFILIAPAAISQDVIKVVFTNAGALDAAASTSNSASLNFKTNRNLSVNVIGCPVANPTINFTKNGTPIAQPTPVPTGTTLTFNYGAANFGGLTNANQVKLTVTCSATSRLYDIKYSPGGPPPVADQNVFEIIKDNAIVDPIIVEAKNHLKNTYDRKHDMAYIVLGPDGEVLSEKPVNLDEDDQFTVYIIAPSNEINKYNITHNGVYNPSDLSMTNPPNPNFGAQSAAADEWTAKKFPLFGPFTSSEAGVTFQIVKQGEKSPIIPTQSLTFPINKFYHVDFGVSVVTTDLESPDYKVFPLESSDNTIIAVNEGKRTMITFNAIWYWKSTINKLFKKRFRHDAITRGRDRIKEPYFWDRINPTFGLSIDQGFRENYFVGGVFEFARGGNICVGGHYGKVSVLADKKFVLGETVFTGTNEDIVTSKIWKWGFYFGITLDTRIFNRITSSLGAQ